MTRYNADDVMSAVQTLTSEVREMRREHGQLRRDLAAALQALQRSAPAGAGVLHDSERGQFLPGTGWVDDARTPGRVEPAPPTTSAEYHLSDEEVAAGRAGLEAARAARKASSE